VWRTKKAGFAAAAKGEQIISCRNEQVRYDAHDLHALEKIVNAACLNMGLMCCSPTSLKTVKD
jgi:hypothetical protein